MAEPITLIILDDDSRVSDTYRMLLEMAFKEQYNLSTIICSEANAAMAAFRRLANEMPGRFILLTDLELEDPKTREMTYSNAYIRMLEREGIVAAGKIIVMSTTTDLPEIAGAVIVQKDAAKVKQVVEMFLKEINGAACDMGLRQELSELAHITARLVTSFADRVTQQEPDYARNGRPYNGRKDYFREPDALWMFR